jgi:hypothetical protein
MNSVSVCRTDGDLTFDGAGERAGGTWAAPVGAGKRQRIYDSRHQTRGGIMVALIVLLLILAVLGGLGFAAHVLWFVLLVAVALWLLGFVIGGVDAGVGRRRWYGRW